MALVCRFAVCFVAQSGNEKNIILITDEIKITGIVMDSILMVSGKTRDIFKYFHAIG